MAVNLSPVGGVAAQFFSNNGVPLAGGKIFTYSAGTTTPAATYVTALGVTAWTNPIVLDAAGRVPSSGEIWLTDGVIYKFILKDANDVLIATYDNITGINSNFVNFTASQEIQTATAGQTVFDLTTMQYQPGTNSLTVYVDGVNQYGPGAQYAYLETDSDTVTFISGLHVGASVKFTTATQTTGNATDASVVAYTPPFANSVTTNVEDKLAQTVSIKDFGAVGDNSTDDTTAIQNAINSLSVNGSLYIPKTSTAYLITSTLTVTKPIRIFGDGIGSLIRKATPGDALHINGTGVVNQLNGVIIDNIAVATEGVGPGGDAIQLTHVGRSSISNVYIPSAVSAGIRSFGSAHITYKTIEISSNLPYTVGTRTLPATGISLQVDPVSGLASGHNTFINCQVSSTLTSSPSVGYGVFVAQNCAHNVFVNGAFTYANYGMLFEQGAELNTVIGTVLEENEIIDYQVGGHRNTFINAQGFSIALSGAAGGIRFMGTAYNNSVYGGRYRNIYTETGCVGTILNNPTIFYLVDNGTQTQQSAIYSLLTNQYQSSKIVLPSTNWAGGGMFSVRASQNPNKLVSLGFDASYYTYGAGYINTVFDGTANVPLLLNPSIGKVAVGVPSADPGGSNNLALPPASAPTLNHTGVTIYTEDGLSIKFLDKNGIVRTISFT